MCDRICVKHRDGWCATKREKSLQYSDSVPTLCDHYVTLPMGIQRREPDCPDCLAKLKQAEKKGY